MAIFASTTLSNYSDPYRALTLKALEKRQADMANEMANAQVPKTETAIGAAGAGLGAIGDVLQKRAADKALAQGRQDLAGIMSGVDPVKGPTPQQAAMIYRYDPELGGKFLTQQYETGAQDRKFLHEDQTLEKTQGFQRGEKQLDRTQTKELADQQRQLQLDLADNAAKARAELAAAERDFKGVQNELDRATQTGNLQLKSQLEGKLAEAQQRHELAKDAANNAAKAALPQSDPGKVSYDVKQGNLTAGQGASALASMNAPKPAAVKGQTEAETQYRQHVSGLQRLERAQALLDEGIYSGPYGGIKSGASTLTGGMLGDEKKGQRTNEFNSIVNKEAIEAMSKTLKGASTDFEMRKFIELINNPNVSDAARAEGLRNLVTAARADRDIQAEAVKRYGGDTSSIDENLAKPGGAPAASAGATVKDPLEGRTATGPNGEKMIRRGGKWESM